MLLENDRRCERGFEAVSCVMTNNPAKAPQRGASWGRLVVVGQRVQPPLNIIGRAKAPNQPPFFQRETT
jgi:hypothetical protein